MNIALWLKVFKRNLMPESLRWRGQKYSSPSPQHVKIGILTANALPNAIWIETGTYLGDTTSKLSKIAKRVISIEPQKELSEFASRRFRKRPNVEIINSPSEDCIKEILNKVTGPTCFWLDGHYSGDITFQGAEVSPINIELSAISDYLRSNKVVIFIDDFRLFVNSVETGYPAHTTLVAWAVENALSWTVEQDIFIAKS